MNIDELYENHTTDVAESYFKRAKNYVKNNKVVIGLSVTLVCLSAYTYTLHKNPHIKTEEKIVYLDTPEAILKTKNIFIKNLDELEVTKTRTTKSSFTKEPIFGVWFKVENSNGFSTYIANFEPVKNLKYNKKYYKPEDAKEVESLLKIK